MLDLDPIKARLAAATPGPWGSCPDDGCKCSAIMSPDYPVAEVTKGAWGDDFPAVRLVGESSLNMKAEAYMEQITYGEVSEQQFLANRRHGLTGQPRGLRSLFLFRNPIRKRSE